MGSHSKLTPAPALRRRPRGAARAGGVRRTALRLLAAALLCLIVLLLIAVRYPSSARMPSARPTETGFSIVLEDLCAHPGVPPRPWRYIVIHHSATTEGGAAAFQRYHIREHGWDSLGYHFVIGNGTQTADGEIEVGPRWPQQREGSHAGVRRYNEEGIGICLVGDFRTQRPTELQMRSLEALIRCLSASYAIAPDDVLGHSECPGAATECPGPQFPMSELRDRLR